MIVGLFLFHGRQKQKQATKSGSLLCKKIIAIE
jgi:hypothetical protein